MVRALLPLLIVLGCPPPADDDDTIDDDDSADDDDTIDDDDSTPDGPFEETCATVPTPPAEGWTGPLFDSHIHTSIFPEHSQEDFARRLLDEMNAAGVERAVVIGPHVAHFADNMDWLRDLEAEWGDLITRCDRLQYQLSAFEPDDVDAIDYVSTRLDEAPFAGVGAVDLEHPFSSRSVDAPGIPPILDLLESRGLPFQFHGLSNDDDPFTDRMLEVVQERPALPFVWFGCPDAVLFGPAIDNLSCTALPGSLDCAEPCDGPTRDALDRSLLGMDVGPLGLNPWPEGQSPLGYESFEEGALQARQRLAALPENVATSIAYGRFEAAFGEQ